jgi:NADH-ubiquinone oxidoreductase chain 5
VAEWFESEGLLNLYTVKLYRGFESHLFYMCVVVVFLPFLSSILSGLCGRFLGPWGTAYLTLSSLAKAFFGSLILFFKIAKGVTYNVTLASWISCEVFDVDWGFVFDSLAVLMCLIVIFISFLVHLYSLEYMSHDPHLPRFLSYLSLFTFLMLILVTADNYIQMFVGWEGVGLASYLLINFWYTRIQANKAAIKAMIMNRVGDFFLLIGVLLVFTSFKTVDYSSIAVLSPLFKNTKVAFVNSHFDANSVIGVFLFFGAVGKSAQLGLHTWLPDAMEGPTPVSALIHAATMVTAGVFLIVRSSFIYEHTSNILELVAILGSVTALFASSVGLVQNDIKKVIAYSTCSQLGYMIFACGLSNYSVGFFHLLTHAFFKALLFLSAGSVIHAVNDEQDMRKLGGLGNVLPYTNTTVLIGSLALIGFPFLSGFYSKDLILETAIGSYSQLGYFCYYLGSLGAFFTAFYSMRLFFLTFISKPNGHKKIFVSVFDAGKFILLSLGALAIASIGVGFVLKDLIVGSGSSIFEAFVSTSNYSLYDAEFLNIVYKLLPVFLSMLGFLSALFLYTFKSNLLFKIKMSNLGRAAYSFLNRKWYFDKIYTEYLSQRFFKFGFSVSYKFIDRGIFEIVGATGVSTFASYTGLVFHKLQKKSVYHNVALILIGIANFFVIRQMWLLVGHLSWFILFIPVSVLCFILYFYDV